MSRDLTPQPPAGSLTVRAIVAAGEMRMGSRDEPGRGGPLAPFDWWCALPFGAKASSSRLGWSGVQAADYRAAPASELEPPALTHHRLILFTRPPEGLDLRYHEVRRHVPPSAGSIVLVPAGTPARYRWEGCMDVLNVYLDPDVLARVAVQTFDLDPARLTVPPLDGSDLPQLRAAMAAVGHELSAAGGGGRLVAESLANLVAVQLIREFSAHRAVIRGRDGGLPAGRLRAVVEYIEEHLECELSLDDLAAVAHLSPFHFARQFRAATGLPPHQFVIARRVERARHILQEGGLSLAQVAVRVGFGDQSQFSRHFKRLVGVTPGRFR